MHRIAHYIIGIGAIALCAALYGFALPRNGTSTMTAIAAVPAPAVTFTPGNHYCEVRWCEKEGTECVIHREFVIIGTCWDAVEACGPFNCPSGRHPYVEMTMAAGCGNGKLPAANECVWVTSWSGSTKTPNTACTCFTQIAGAFNCTLINSLIKCATYSSGCPSDPTTGTLCCVSG